MTPGGRRAAAAAISFLAACALYAGSLRYDFVVDDLHQIEGNPWIESAGGLREALTQGVWDFEGRASSYYRPMMYVIYAAVRWALGPEPWGFHLANLLLHAAASSAAALAAGALLARGAARKPALASAAVGVLFAAHPVHVEPVAWCAGVVDVGMGLCFLLAVWLYIASEDRIDARYLGAVSAFAVALFFKEPAAMLPLVLVAFDGFFLTGRRGWGRTMGRMIPFAVTLGAYLAIRGSALRGIAPTVRPLDLSPGDHALALADLLTRYVGKLALPTGLNFWTVFSPPSSLLSPRGVAITLTIAALAVTAAAAWRHRPLPAFAAVVALVPLVPAFALGALNQGISGAFAERYLYVPVFGFALLLVATLDRLAACHPRAGRSVIAVGVSLAAFYAAGTLLHLPVWRDSLSLWSDTARRSPRSAIARSNLGFALLYAGRGPEGQAALTRAVELDPELPEEWLMKGVAYARHGLGAKAILAFHTALALDPDLAEAHFNLGVLHDERGERDFAIAAYERAVALDPANATARNNLGIAYAEAGRMREAVASLEEAARIAPDDVEIRRNLERARGASRSDADPPG